MSFDLKNPEGVLRFVRSVDYPYVPSAIYPSEMAYFIYKCEQAGIECIIESGRDFGYSAAVLVAYGRLRGVRIISIDLEMDPSAARACRERLSRFSNLEVMAGDGFRVIPRILKTEKGCIALLIDGPKRHKAIYLSAAACAVGNVHLVAHHNVPYDHDVFAHLCKRFPRASRLEQSTIYRHASFSAFHRWERGFTTGTHRDLEQTTLLVSPLDHPGPDKRYIEGLTLHQTKVSNYINVWWRFGFGAPNPWFVKLSRRIISVIRSRQTF